MKYNYLLNNPNPPKEIICFDLDGNILSEYISIRKASQHLNIAYQAISKVLNKKRLRVSDYFFEYKENYNPNINYSYKNRLARHKLYKKAKQK